MCEISKSKRALAPETSLPGPVLVAGTGDDSIDLGRITVDYQVVALPHIPDNPTEQEVLSLLDQLTYSVVCLDVGANVPVNRFDPPASQRRELKLVWGICWRGVTAYDPKARTITIHVQGKPYAMPLDYYRWLQLKSKDNERRSN